MLSDLIPVMVCVSRCDKNQKIITMRKPCSPTPSHDTTFHLANNSSTLQTQHTCSVAQVKRPPLFTNVSIPPQKIPPKNLTSPPPPLLPHHPLTPPPIQKKKKLSSQNTTQHIIDKSRAPLRSIIDELTAPPNFSLGLLTVFLSSGERSSSRGLVSRRKRERERERERERKKESGSNGTKETCEEQSKGRSEFRKVIRSSREQRDVNRV